MRFYTQTQYLNSQTFLSSHFFKLQLYIVLLQIVSIQYLFSICPQDDININSAFQSFFLILIHHKKITRWSVCVLLAISIQQQQLNIFDEETWLGIRQVHC